MDLKDIRHAIITGASGFIGQALVRSLVKNGVEIIAVDRNSTKQNICKALKLDISEPGVLDQHVKEETIIFHLAAKASVRGSVIDPASDFNSTCHGIFQILETARRTQCRVIFPSTASIYDTENTLPITENSHVKPSSPYGAAKVAGEAYCFVYHRCYGVDVRIARMFSVYGVGMGRFAIHDIIRNIQKDKDKLTLLGDGKQIRDYLYIDDVVYGLQLIAVNGEAGEDYNLASGKGISILKLAKSISLLMDCPQIDILTSVLPFQGDVPKLYGDISKVKSIGFSQTVTLNEGLLKTIKWLEDT